MSELVQPYLEALDSHETEVLTGKKKSLGQLFKEKHGYSRTMAKNMKKHKCLTPDQYRKVRKERRKK